MWPEKIHVLPFPETMKFYCDIGLALRRLLFYTGLDTAQILNKFNYQDTNVDVLHHTIYDWYTIRTGLASETKQLGKPPGFSRHHYTYM